MYLHKLLVSLVAIFWSIGTAWGVVQVDSPASVILDAGSEFFPAANLANSSGLSGAPDVYNLHGITHAPAGSGNAWVTDGAGSDYFNTGILPVMTFDLGSVKNLTDLVLWGYHFGSPNNNEAKLMDVGFSTDGTTFGSSVSVDHGRAAAESQTVPLGGVYSARYVRLSLTDNYFGQAGATGGDRVGLGEVQFISVTDPADILGSTLPYAYTTTPPYATPGYSGGTYYFDDTHGPLASYTPGDLTDGLAFPSTLAPTATPTQNTLVGFDPASDQARMTFDLGGLSSVDTVRIGTHTWSAFANGAPDSVDVLFSTDGVMFGSPVSASITGPSFDGHHDVFLDASGTSAQYVQLQFDGGAVGNNNPNKYLFDEITFYGTAIPEPSSLLLTGLGLVLVLRRRR